MVPQIDNSINSTDLLVENKIPNKTYKLTFDEDHYRDIYHNEFVTFNIINGHLFVNYPETENDDEFDLTDGDLFVSSEDDNLENKYDIIRYHLIQNITSKYLLNEKVDRIGGFITDDEAIKQAIYHILSVERYSCLIYDSNYGVELEQYIGQDMDYLEATIENTLEEALIQDERISGVTVLNIEKVGDDLVNIRFAVDTAVNEIQMEVNVNV